MRLHRERIQLKAERTRQVNRIGRLLNLHGIRDVKGLWGGARRQWLSDLQTGDGRQLGSHLRRELGREFDRLDLVIRHICSLDDELEAGLVDDTARLKESNARFGSQAVTYRIAPMSAGPRQNPVQVSGWDVSGDLFQAPDDNGPMSPRNV